MPSAGDRALHTMERYLQLCDVPSPVAARGDRGGQLAELFTEDAVWEGTGQEHAALYGRTAGRAAIAAMLAGHLPPRPHFRANVHLLLPGTVDVRGQRARGRWLMQQLSHHAAGDSALVVARLDVTFHLVPRAALISVFRTERLFHATLGGPSGTGAGPAGGGSDA